MLTSIKMCAQDYSLVSYLQQQNIRKQSKRLSQGYRYTE